MSYNLKYWSDWITIGTVIEAIKIVELKLFVIDFVLFVYTDKTTWIIYIKNCIYDDWILIIIN